MIRLTFLSRLRVAVLYDFGEDLLYALQFTTFKDFQCQLNKSQSSGHEGRVQQGACRTKVNCNGRLALLEVKVTNDTTDLR